MNLQLVQAREDFKAAREDYTPANKAIKDAKPGDDLDALKAEFNNAEERYTLAKVHYDAGVRVHENARLGRTRVVREDLTYTPRKQGFFRDMVASREGNLDAAQRLQQDTRELEKEMGRTRFDLNSTDATGGQLVAPLYLHEEFVAFARAGMRG